MAVCRVLMVMLVILMIMMVVMLMIVILFLMLVPMVLLVMVVVLVIMTFVVVLMPMGVYSDRVLARQTASTIFAHHSISKEATCNSRPARSSALGV